MRSMFFLICLCLLNIAPTWGMFLLNATPAEEPASISRSEEKPTTQPPKKPLSDAEKIIKLQRSLEADRKELKVVEKELATPPEDYRKAEKQFMALDEQLGKLKEKIKQLKKDGKDEEATQLEKELKPLEKRWQTAKDLFNTAVQERKTLQQKAEALKDKIKKDQQALDQLTGKAKPKKETPQPASAVEGKKPEGGKKDTATTQPGKGTPSAKPAPPMGTEKGTKPADKTLNQAQQEARLKEEEAREAEQKATSVIDRIKTLRKNIEAEQRILQAAEKKAELARTARANLEKELDRKEDAGAPREERVALQKKIREAQDQLQEADSEARASRTRLTRLQGELSALQAEQSIAMLEAEKKRQEAEEARGKVALLENPLHPRNIWRWTITHGPRVLLILVGLLVLYWLVVVSTSKRIVALVERRTGRQKRMEEDRRAETLVGIFRQAVKVLLLTFAILMLLDEMGISITTLMGGVAVFGLAVSFATQSLIKDYFTGFLLLMEDQYSVGDVVKIGDVAGMVEKINMRVTVLRDLEGVVHFIPNGSITTVSNMTHGWSRALFDIAVAYKEDPDRVIEVLRALCTQMRQDQKFGPMILDDLHMLGVDAFTDSSVVIKFFLKTKPLKQWDVKRELLRRIKRRFHELGIEIPFPHRTVYYRHDGPPPGTNGARDGKEQAEQLA